MPIRCGNRKAHGGDPKPYHPTKEDVRRCHLTEGGIASIREQSDADSEAAAEAWAESAWLRAAENAGADEADLERQVEASRGVVSFADASAASKRQMAVADHAPWDGIYTIESPASGLPHRTFRLKTQAANDDFAPGKQVIGYLSGSDNERDYTSFGFVDRNALGYFVRVWKAHRENNTVLRDAEQLLLHSDAYLSEAYCFRCGRRLTVPASVNQGLGPECAKKVA